MGPVTPGVQGEHQHHTIRVGRGRSDRIPALSGRPAGGAVRPEQLGRAAVRAARRRAGVEKRRISLPLPQYAKLRGFTEANDIYIETALALGGKLSAGLQMTYNTDLLIVGGSPSNGFLRHSHVYAQISAAEPLLGLRWTQR